MRLSIICIFAITLFAGCPKARSVAKPAAPLESGKNVTVANNAAGTAQATLDAAGAARLGKVAADSDAAHKALTEGRTEDAKGAIGVQQGHLEGVKRDKQEAEQLADAETKRAAGDTAGADAALLGIRKAAQDDAVKISNLERERDAAVMARDKALEDYRIECETNMRRQQKAIDDALAAAKKAQDEQHNAMLQAQAEKLTWIGISCISAAIAAAVGIGVFGSLLVLRKLGIYLIALAGIGFLFLGAAQIISQWWFMWACAIAIIGILVAVGAWAWRHQKRGDLAQELAVRSGKIADLYKQVSPVLDEAYESGTQTLEEVAESFAKKGKATVQDLLDRAIFDRLSSKMAPADKKLVQALRAES